MPDSNAVSGALVISMGSGKTTDSNGYYEFSRSYTNGDTDPLELQVTVADVDGVNNGVFVSKDTLISVEGMEHIQDITIQIDLYVEMIDNSPNLLLPTD